MALPVARRAPYKDFLQPALQRRFAGTAAIILILSYLEALTLSRWNSFIWSWMPLGLPGLRALAIFISVLPIIVLRIAQSHTGIRTSNSPFETLTNVLLPSSTYDAIITYVISAVVFSQVYLKSTSEEAGIRWISQVTGRSRLNEHAVFFTTNLAVLGLVQGIANIALDQDRLLLGAIRTKRQGDEDARDDAAEGTTAMHWATKLGEWTPILVVRCGMLSITVAMANYVFLYHFMRLPAWRWAMWIFRPLYSDLPKYNLPPGSAPWSIWMLMRTIWASFLLCLLWYFGDIAFRLQLTREPLKNGQPLTAESKDPNGSLLNGLKSKKPRIKAFAMWELAFIARDYTPRRLSILEDIDRKDGPMWSQIYALCLDTVKGIERRIDEYGKPALATPGTEPALDVTQPRERITQPLRTNDISAPKPAAKISLVTNTVSKLVTSPGKTPMDKWVPGIKKTATQAADTFMTKEQKEAVQPQALRGQLGTLSLRLLTLPVVGPIFQQTFSRRLAKAVLGTPYAEISVYINAAYALSHLAVCSLTEDKYGNVQRDVPTIIRTFTTVIKKLEAFQDELPTHWTDLGQNRQCPPAAAVLAALKDGLGALLEAFGEYSSDLRLSRTDMRLAREAAQNEQGEMQAEMRQVGQ
ncbi:putative nucleoporin protein Ndc1-Nup [Rosellinia necatrix]|uniref:Putative nucleoporin protein Ndc1-Nup n=1 Tax=Rosellinia necatrix TaxID=77044 RepID=A0A1W2TK83_ROSNE|nr:putative nucleoporin protein Ndc1-Nup [Rosellinia necatrix]